MKKYILMALCLLITIGAIAAPPPVPKSRTAFSGPCNFDSGWIPVERGEDKMIQHNVYGDIDNYVVYFQYRTEYGTYSNNFYGGVDFGTKTSGGTSNNERHGAYWHNLTLERVMVYRRPEDQYAKFVRIKIWYDPSDDWDSEWMTIPAGDLSVLTHNLEGVPDDYVVYMEFKDDDVYGINQMFYGRGDLGANPVDGLSENNVVGANWNTLTKFNIVINRCHHDIYADQIRVRIFKRQSPTYDSGWSTINTDQLKLFTHNIHGSIDDYVIDLQYKHTDWGVNQVCFGGNDFGDHNPYYANENDRAGAYWMELNSDSITAYRRAEDPYASEVRIRIWHVWEPSAPEYDSLWKDIAADTILGLSHNLSFTPEDGLLDLQFRNIPELVNQCFYGGADMGSKSFGGTENNYRIGAYWYNLSNTSITIKRRAEDESAAQVRLRIWRMPKPDYNSGWVSLSQSASVQLNHNLGEDIMDCLVDLQFKSPLYGINHIFYGGGDLGNSPPTGLDEDSRMGAYWRDMDDASITVYRRPDDIYAPQIRVRIWRIALPDYGSPFFSLNPNSIQELPHNLNGNAQLYLVKMEQFCADYGINHQYYGGADFGASPPAGHAADDRIGAYWRSLTPSSITAFRRAEDTYAEQIRVRIWRLPPYYSLSNIRDYILGKSSFGDRFLIDGDVNGDSTIDIADIIFYLNTYGGTF
ncbi:hypothetical protein JW926_02555 [Candidatus Sumerlaeota bacterium]|nr:hypothetical protein [Candidatus Sumerlaeota bacterium]